jgi:hypothetical protein
MNKDEARDVRFANQIKELCMSGDEDGDHSRADELLIELLRILGFTRTAAAWEEVGK